LVSEVGFGAWAIGGPAKLGQNTIGWGPVHDSTSLRALQACFDNGINFIDTADVYGWGHSEELIGQAFKGKRDRVIIATKVGNRLDKYGNWIKDFSPQWVTQAVEASLRRLQADYIDVYQLHSPDVDFKYSDAVFEVFEELQQSGKIRFYGVSIGPVAHGLEISRLNKGSLFQVVYNLLRRELEADLFRVAQEKNIGIIARVPLASGFLTGKFRKGHRFHPEDHRSKRSGEEIDRTIEKVESLRFLENDDRTLSQAALQFCLSHPAVSVCIPGAKTPEQVRMNAAASELGPLTGSELEQIDRVLGKSD